MDRRAVQPLLAIVAATLVIGTATSYRPRSNDVQRTTRMDSRRRAGGAVIGDARVDLAELDVVSQQPAVIYADARAFSFNTGYGPTAGPEQWVSFATPRATRSHSGAPILGRRGATRTVRGERRVTAAADGPATLAFAKTVTFFFAADSANARVPGAFALWREVNDGPPQALVRNVLPDTVPFFVYQCAVQATAGSDSLAEVPSERLPITFADTTGAGVDAQSLRAVELHFLVTNGARGAAQKVERISILAMLPDGGHAIQPVGNDQSPARTLILAAAPRASRSPRARTTD